MEHAKLCLQESSCNNCSTVDNQCVLCESAIKHGNLVVVQYLRTTLMSRYEPNETLENVRLQGCDWNETTCAAVRYGHFDCLKYMIANGCVWDETTCTTAAKYNQMPILQWAHEHGCPWDEMTCAAAALEGHLSIVQWLIENGCLWNEQTCRNAATNGHLNVVQYALQHDCPCPINDIRTSSSVPDHIKEWFNRTYPPTATTEVESLPPT